MPAAHGEHEVESSAAYEPARHAEHVLAPLATPVEEPAAHTVHVAAPARENLPATQEAHVESLDAPTAELDVPAAQSPHDP